MSDRERNAMIETIVALRMAALKIEAIIKTIKIPKEK